MEADLPPDLGRGGGVVFCVWCDSQEIDSAVVSGQDEGAGGAAKLTIGEK